MPISTLNLRPTLLRLRLDQGEQLRKIQQIEGQKTALFDQGVQQTVPALQKVLARRILTLEHLSKVYQKSLEVTQRQIRLVVNLLYAQEMGDRLQDRLLQTVDWEDVLRGMSKLQIQQQAQLELIDSILEVLESRRPVSIPDALSAQTRKSELMPRRVSDQSTPAGKPKPVPHLAPTQSAHIECGEVAVAVHVPDGDGLKLADGRRVRYIGIDAPEMHTWDGCTEVWAEEARDFNRKLVEGKFVRLVCDQSDTDQYGRLLRYVYVGNKFINAELVRAGLAYTINVPPDTSHMVEFDRLEKQTRRARRGIWSE